MPRFPRPSGPKHFFTWVSFHSAWFLKNLLGYVSLSFTAPTCREESFHSALRTQPSMCLVSLGLLDLDPNNFLHGFTFPQPSFSKTCWGTFPSASRHLHVEKSRFTVPRFPWLSQTIFDTGLLSLSLVSQKLVGVRFPQLHGTNM